MKVIVYCVTYTLLSLGLVALVLPDWYVEKRLGGKYVISYMSSTERDLCYKKNAYSYARVLPSSVLSCGHDNKWIIAKTNNGTYYIIDKRKDFIVDNATNIIGPLDSLRFYALKDILGIHLQLTTIPQSNR